MNAPFSERDPDGYLYHVITRGGIDEIKWYFTEHPDKINEGIKSMGDYSILSTSVRMGLPPDLIQFLIEKGARVNNRDLITSLLYNVDESSDFETARILINNGADINYRVLEAVIKGYVGGKYSSYSPDQVGMKMKILDFLFGVRDSEGRRLELDCHYKNKYGLTMFKLAEEKHGPDFEAFLRKKCNEHAATNINSLLEAWQENQTSGKKSRIRELPLDTIGRVAEYLGGPTEKYPNGRNRRVHPYLMPSMLRGATIPKGHEGRLIKLREWEALMKKRARASQRNKVGGRRRITRRRR